MSSTDNDWSTPENEVLQRARELVERGNRGVLATVVDVEGSAYRRPGAKMLVSADGTGIGHITAGCLEDEVQRLATDVLASGEPRLETYDLMPEADDDVWGLGVGCNGVIDILLEPLDDGYRPVLDAVADGRDVGVVTITDGPDDLVGTRAYYDPEADGFEVVDDTDFSFDPLREVVAALLADGSSETVDVDGVSIFVDSHRSPDDFVVIGTGNDVRPIIELGMMADFRVTVVGFRGATATPDRFPNAADVLSTSPARIRDTLDFDADTYVVVATHNFVDDRIVVDELLRTKVPYIGLMGPHERFEEMLEDFKTEGKTFSSDELTRLFTPVGLDLGGGSPYQIALSIVSEIVAVRNDRDPKHLREREGTIHDRVTPSIDTD